MASFKVFQVENHQDIDIKLVGSGKEGVALGTELFIAVGVFLVELLACQVSMVCATNWPRKLYLRA